MRFTDDDKYDRYAESFALDADDRQARRKRKPKARHTPKKSQQAIIQEIADTTGLEVGELAMTYKPSLHESGWLGDSLRAFFDQSLVTDVLALVKGGKEASVYRCEAHPSAGTPYLAAKVYRPQQFRSLSNDAMYREGRAVIGVDGKEVREHDKRTIRAIEKGSRFGRLVSHTSWLMHEFNTLHTLHTLGADVPRPFASSENALLMSYHGDSHGAAHTLHEVTLDTAEAAGLFERVLHNIDLMLAQGIIHGDLSAYNILYWQGAVTLIDFPQVVNPQSNPNARAIFDRDVRRVVQYFERYGIDADAEALAASLWGRHVTMRSEAQIQADLSRFEVE